MSKILESWKLNMTIHFLASLKPPLSMCPQPYGSVFVMTFSCVKFYFIFSPFIAFSSPLLTG